MTMNGNTKGKPTELKIIFLLMVAITISGCIFQSDEKLKLNNPLDPNSDAYVEAAVGELNIENGQKIYTSDITVTWKGNEFTAEYQCVLGDSSYLWNTSSWIKLNDPTPGEYLFKVTPRNQAGFEGKTVECLFTILETPAVETISIENGQVITTPDVEITWTGNATAKSYQYSLNDDPGEWSYATTASFEGLVDSVYTFSITAKNDDFTGAPNNWTFIVDTAYKLPTISGTVTGADEVTILLSGDTSEARITGNDGTFSFNLADGGTYILTPKKPGYSFEPESVNLDGITTDIKQDFTALLNQYAISGTITGADDVTVQLTGDAENEVTVDDGGSYSFTVDALGNYLILLQKDGYKISPSSALYVSLLQDITQNFELVNAAITISGLVTGLDDVTVRISGDLENTQIVDDSDRYEFIVTEGGNYTVSVFKDECMFNAYDVDFENITSSKVQDFNGQLIPEDIKNRFFEYAQFGNTTQMEVMLGEMPLLHSVKDIYGSTPLRQAAVLGLTETVQLLLDWGADIEAKDDNGETPLHMAALRDRTEMVQLLLGRGAYVNALTNNNKTPLDLAEKNSHTETAEILREAGGKLFSEL